MKVLLLLDGNHQPLSGREIKSLPNAQEMELPNAQSNVLLTMPQDSISLIGIHRQLFSI